MTKLGLLLIPIVLFTACAKVKIRPLKPAERFDQSKYEQKEEADKKQIDEYYATEGVRFFRPYPYVWITASDTGACEMSIVYLPKMDEEYIITAEPGIGSVTINPQLTYGWSLTGLNATVDSKANEMVTAIGNLTGNLAKAAAGGALVSSGGRFGPGLYRMVFEKGFVTDLSLVFLQEEAPAKPAKCEELKPPKQEK